jgi:hypothetical protein
VENQKWKKMAHGAEKGVLKVVGIQIILLVLLILPVGLVGYVNGHHNFRASLPRLVSVDPSTSLPSPMKKSCLRPSEANGATPPLPRTRSGAVL